MHVFLAAHAPVLRRIAYQLVHETGLDLGRWMPVAHGVVVATVMFELPGLVRSRVCTQNLMGCLGPAVRRAWRDAQA